MSKTGSFANEGMQGRNEDYEWASRAEIQCARLLNVAAKKGNKWHASKVYQMSVLNFNLAENDSNAFSWYNMREKGGKRELSGLLNVLFLELPKLKKLYGTPPEKLTKLEKWGLFLSYADKDDAQEYIASLMQKEDGLMNAKSALNTISEDERNKAVETARILKQSGVYMALIEKSTGLSEEEIAAL